MNLFWKRFKLRPVLPSEKLLVAIKQLDPLLQRPGIEHLHRELIRSAQDALKQAWMIDREIEGLSRSKCFLALRRIKNL